ncbi:hypothetical protein BgiMline_035538 [Biomphalaria glabrata]
MVSANVVCRSADSIQCSEDEYLEGGQCKPCPDNHNRCFPGRIKSCKTKEWFTVDKCSHCRTCRPCSECGLGVNLYLDFQAAPCTDHTDTVCCEEENMDNVGGQCVHRAKTTAPLVAPIETSDTSTAHFQTDFLEGNEPETEFSRNIGAFDFATHYQMFLLNIVSAAIFCYG